MPQKVLQLVNGVIKEVLLTDAPGSVASSGTYLVSGATVAWVSDHTYRVGAANYYINGTNYISVEQIVTAAAADPTFDRIDVLALDTAGTLVILEGTAAAAPAQPDVDPTLYLQVSFIYVAAGTSTAPVTETSIYKEGVEWVTTPSAGTIVVGSLNSPRSGTKDIEGTAVAAGTSFTAVSPVAVDLATQNNLVFYVNCKAAWPSKKAMQLTVLSGATTIKGQQISVGNGQYGFNSQITGYQQVVVPVTDFGVPAGVTIDRLRVSFIGTGATIGFYIDDIVLQAGFTASTGNKGNVVFRGTWDATVSYAINDLILKDGIGYIALAANINASPPSSPTFWGGLGATSSGSVSVEAYAANKALDWTGKEEIQITLTGDLTITAMTGMTSGGRYILTLKQDATGSRLLTISASNIQYSDDIPSLILSTTALAEDTIGLVYNSATSKMKVAAFNRGFA